MGNCAETAKKSTAEITPSSDLHTNSNSITLYGQPNTPCTTHIQLALLYKSITLNFIPSNQPLTLLHQSDVVSGSVPTLIRYLDAKFPENTLKIDHDWFLDTMLVVWLVKLQHKSLSWHLERVVTWVDDMVTRGGKVKGDGSVGSVRMEVRRFGKRYGRLVEVLVEHAQMEETVLFLILEAQDRGLCKAANEEHARDLPLMNGIREEIKTIGVMNQTSPDYQEALLSLSSRLKKLKDNCEHHFEEEEKELLPLLEAAELNKSQQEKIMQQSLDVMTETHSHMFRFFVEGLQPQDAMRYFELVNRYCDNIHV